MAITERIGFETADAIANLTALQTAIRGVNTSLRTLNRNANAAGGLNNAAAAFRNVNTQARAAQTGISGATTAMRTAGRTGSQAANSLTISWQTFGRVLVTQAIVRTINAIGQAMGEAADRAAEFEEATARIANITDEGAAGIDNLRESIRELAVATGRDLEEATGAALEALQNDLGTTAETFELLTGTANDLARATGTDLTSAVNSLSSVMKAYNVDASEATNISDALFTAYDKGRVSLEQLESRLGTVTPQAAALGITFEEVSAAVAALTLSGLNAQTAMTQLRNIQAKLIKPTEELQKAFENLGVTTGEELIEKFGGLQGALAALREEFGGNEQAVAKAFNTIRGQLGVLNLLADEGKNFNVVLEAQAENLGVVADAAAEVNKTTTVQLQQQYQQLLDKTIPLGNAITQLKLDTVLFINNFIAGFQRLQQRGDFQALTKFATDFGSAFISVIDDVIAAADRLFAFVAQGAAKAIALIQRIVDPVGATESTRIANLGEQLGNIGTQAREAAQQVTRIFDASNLNLTPLGDAAQAFQDLRTIQEGAVLSAVEFSNQMKANVARINENTTAAEGFRRSLQAATSGANLSDLFGQEFAAGARERLRGISDELLRIQQASAGAEGTAAIELQKQLELQQRKIAAAAEEFGLENKAVQALEGQSRATAQVLVNQQGKAENEQKTASAANLANAALERQKAIAAAAGVSMAELGVKSNAASKAIADIPDPSVDASAAIAQMNALTAAALRAARAVAAANSGGGGGFYHGGFVHRAAGGGIGRGQDTVPAMLSPGEFVMNRRSSGRFFSQLQAMNAGQSPSFRETGGPVTNIGDINVNVSGGSGSENPDQAARQIASGLRRELRRKTSRLS